MKSWLDFLNFFINLLLKLVNRFGFETSDKVRNISDRKENVF